MNPGNKQRKLKNVKTKEKPEKGTEVQPTQVKKRLEGAWAPCGGDLNSVLSN